MRDICYCIILLAVASVLVVHVIGTENLSLSQKIGSLSTYFRFLAFPKSLLANGK